ncbi:hypothetical protein CathTA2_2836 [Caldalkalibacillus thermarum TA2.A1]|uniref:YlbF family regulator n=1 Tax=Caldalkalibacillus thermarum (strain TA2.A1) TaxID=986075 RepID=F5LAA1_CALTT|nr:YlbF family regulator [Caldalkalibacillus thermarum]EGL81650.1 hypothetical protein CathTA2_2836 [Caldalkalibacillus thermarum TA2.A1]QZT33247.1 YlbF family regulator [Caldalkalibacillus thermarum TA2.A1]GGK27706.1 regulatory protein YlbF [Caldalkalibacillus thermarum]
MIASLDLAEILEETDRLAQLILRSEEVKQYRLCKQRLKQDKEAQKLIKRFVQKKEQFEEVERFGRYHPDYDRIKQEMRQLKRELDLNESVANFKKAERTLEAILIEISEKIAYAVSDSIKVPTGNPFFDQIGCGGGGCSGGCGSCGNH